MRSTLTLCTFLVLAGASPSLSRHARNGECAKIECAEAGDLCGYIEDSKTGDLTSLSCRRSTSFCNIVGSSENGTCVGLLPAGSSCDEDEMCEGWQYAQALDVDACQDGKCIALGLLNGETCTLNDSCISLFCSGGKCADNLASALKSCSNYCEVGYVCDDDEYICLKLIEDGDACSNTTYCPGDCSGGVCHVFSKSSGENCSTSIACKSGLACGSHTRTCVEYTSTGTLCTDDDNCTNANEDCECADLDDGKYRCMIHTKGDVVSRSQLDLTLTMYSKKSSDWQSDWKDAVKSYFDEAVLCSSASALMHSAVLLMSAVWAFC